MNPNHHPVKKHGMEVIGKKVLVQHPVEDGQFAWFPGHVREWNDDGHRIVFSSKAEDVWANLESWENDNTLVWVRTDFDEEEIAKTLVDTKVVIEYPIESKKKQEYAWFLAKIRDVRMSTTQGQQIVEHFVRFDDDGVEEWVNLWKLIKQKRLQFLGAEITGVERDQGVAMHAGPEPESTTNERPAQEGDDAAGIATVALP